MNKFQRKKSRIIYKYYKEYLELCKKHSMKEPTYCQIKVYFSRAIKRLKEDKRLKMRIDL